MPPKETRGHRRPPICPIIVFDESEDSSRSSSDNATTDTIDHLDAPTTDSDGDVIMIDTTTSVHPPLFPPSPELQLLGNRPRAVAFSSTPVVLI